ncbi:Apoptosis-inducing factor 2, partial [Rhizoclosmatium hyalinum]
MPVPTIVIIGGSFAGKGVAEGLDKSLRTKANIILIEEREAFYYQVGGLRAAVESNYAQHTWIPYSSLFQHNRSSRVIQARAETVTEKEVKLSNGETIAFDYLVIATGVSHPAPGGAPFISKDDYVNEMERIQMAVEKAESVVIVGGGVVGVELAGEIATDFHGKKVTIIHSASVLMDKITPSAATTKQVNSQLSALGVEVLLNTRAMLLPGATTLLPDKKPYNLSPHKIATTSGQIIQSDVQFICTGSIRPNTTFLSISLPETLDPRGFILVEPTGQLKGFPHIYAVGDVSTLDDAKMAYLATRFQSPVICTNIINAIAGKPASALYTKSTPGGLFIVTIGRFGGVVQTPIGTFGKWAARLSKSERMFLGTNWNEMHQKFLYKTPEHLRVDKKESGIECVAWWMIATVLAVLAAVGIY